MVFVANLLGSEVLLLRLRFCRSAVFISATDVDDVDGSLAKIAGIHIRGKHSSDDVAEMGIVIYIRKSTGDKYIALTRLRQRNLLL